MVEPDASVAIGTVVLIHGGWGNPQDWTWVRRPLEAAGARVATPDLASHRSPNASFSQDVDQVRHIIREATPPLVCAGWSYGGHVMSVAADGESNVSHLVFVASRLPVPSTTVLDASWIDADPHLLVDEHGRYGIDNDWWFESEAKRLFSGEVLEHLRRHPRRPMAIAAATEPPAAAAWQTIPTTVLLGRDDHLISEADRHSIEAKVADVRYLDTDHFILFHQPETVAAAILEILRSAHAR